MRPQSDSNFDKFSDRSDNGIVGSVQLEKFNATIYVADLVSLAMVREMGALMVAIIMAGRTGAAFAVELGNMNLMKKLIRLKSRDLFGFLVLLVLLLFL